MVCCSFSGSSQELNFTRNVYLFDSFELPRGQPSGNGDIELGIQPSASSAELGMEGFFKQVQVIEKQIEKLSTLLQKLQNANEESKAVTKATSIKAIKQRMEKDIDEVGKIARQAKSKVEELDRDGITSAALKKGGLYVFDIGTQYKYKNTLVDVKVDTDSNGVIKIKARIQLKAWRGLFCGSHG